jgi:hypothetical protein
MAARQTPHGEHMAKSSRAKIPRNNDNDNDNDRDNENDNASHLCIQRCAPCPTAPEPAGRARLLVSSRGPPVPPPPPPPPPGPPPMRPRRHFHRKRRAGFCGGRHRHAKGTCGQCLLLSSISNTSLSSSTCSTSGTAALAAAAPSTAAAPAASAVGLRLTRIFWPAGGGGGLAGRLYLQDRVMN